jgi:hypothetical protein
MDGWMDGWTDGRMDGNVLYHCIRSLTIYFAATREEKQIHLLDISTVNMYD